jgi:hypothetical protein
VRAVYAPALVGWVGSRGTHVSWFPLGPRDVYVPGRRFSRHYLDRVNHANTVITDRERLRDAYDRRDNNHHHRNRGVPGAVMAVPRATFTAAERIGNRRFRYEDRETAGVRENGGAPQIAPLRESRMGGVARAQPRVPPAIANRQVTVRRDPPPSAARFARRPAVREQNWQTQPERMERAPATVGEAIIRDRAERQERNDRNDRPNRVGRNRVDRPVLETAPPAQAAVQDSRGVAERIRENRDQRVREVREREETREDRGQRVDRPQNGGREAVIRQSRERAVERERGERPQRVERPQVERRPVETRPVERQRVERPPQAERRETPQERRSNRGNSAAAEGRSAPIKGDRQRANRE